MNRYSYKQYIRDKATLPVMFDALAVANNLSEEEKTQLSQKAGKLAHLLKAPKRMEAIAKDIQEHFTNHVEPKGLKAMVVVYDREACVLMYDLLTKRFGEGTCEVVMNLSQGGIEDEVPVALEKCLAFFSGVDRTIGGYEGLITTQDRLVSNDVRDQFAAEFNVLKKLWEALTPDKFLHSYQKDYRWNAIAFFYIYYHFMIFYS